MIDMQTMVDKSTSHISEMLMVGSNMGHHQRCKESEKNTRMPNRKSRNLMEKLLQLEENNIQELKTIPFLNLISGQISCLPSRPDILKLMIMNKINQLDPVIHVNLVKYVVDMFFFTVVGRNP
jgi:hypothetical protein